MMCYGYPAMTPGFYLIQNQCITNHMKSTMAAYKAAEKNIEYNKKVLKMLAHYDNAEKSRQSVNKKIKLAQSRSDEIIYELCAHWEDLRQNNEFYYDEINQIVDIAENIAYTRLNRQDICIYDRIRAHIAALFQKTR